MFDNKWQSVFREAFNHKPYLTFQDYMALALYHDELGYYQQDPSPLGRDFVTAPMLSKLLGKAISNWLDARDIQDVLELGAGNGALAQQILENPRIKSYRIYDKNLQASKGLQDPRCQWISEISNFNGAVIANELLDALPFQRLCYRKEGLYQWTLNQKFEIDWIPCEPGIDNILSWLEHMPKPYYFEYCDYKEIFENLNKTSGRVLLVDYGYSPYFHPDRALGSLMCYQNQKIVPFSLQDTGKVDITASVNWDLLKERAKGYGYTLAHIGPQSDFILAMVKESEIDRTAWKLISEHEMGYFVKVVEFSKAC